MLKRKSSRRNSSPMEKRKQIGVGLSKRRKSSSSGLTPPPEFPVFNYRDKCPNLLRLTDDDSVDLSDTDLIFLQHELECMLAECAMNTRRAKGELQFLNNGDYPKEDLKKRILPKYQLRTVIEQPTVSNSEHDGVCGLPEEAEEDDINCFPPYNIPLRFWTWAKEDFMKPIDVAFLKTFKNLIVEKYSFQSTKPFLLNEPWKYRQVASPVRGKKGKARHSISNEAAINLNASKSVERDKDIKNSKLIPMIDSLLISAMKESPRKGRQKSNAVNRDDSDEKRYTLTPQNALKSDVEVNRSDKSYEDGANVNGINGMNDHNMNGYINGANLMNGTITQLNESMESNCSNDEEDISYCHLEEFDAKAIGSKIVAKLIAGKVLPESSADVFEEMTRDDPPVEQLKVEVNEEGRCNVDDPGMDELSFELNKCQLELISNMKSLNSIIENSWKKAKAHYAYMNTFEQLRAADYHLFRLGNNMYREIPRKMPSLAEQPLLKEAMKSRNKMARMHYVKMYRRHPKYRLRPKLNLTQRKRRLESS